LSDSVSWHRLKRCTGAPLPDCETYFPLIAGAILGSAKSTVGWASPLARAGVSLWVFFCFAFSSSFFGSAGFFTPILVLSNFFLLLKFECLEFELFYILIFSEFEQFLTLNIFYFEQF
jgi:hypothetical protein